MSGLKKTKKLVTYLCVVLASLSGCNSSDIDKSIVPISMGQIPMAKQVTIRKYQTAPVMLNALVLFSKETNVLDGWNHVESYPDEFDGLKFRPELYRIESKPDQNIEEYQYKTTLIKKFGDWNHQHANGITAQFSELAFSKVAGIEIVLRINNETSNLPSLNTLSKAYNNLVSDELLEKLDDGNVHLSLTLSSQDTNNTDLPKFNAEYLLSFDAKKHVDNWYHVFIPVSALNAYNEINYKQTPLSENESKSMMISGFRLMAETHSTKVIRNFIPELFDESVPKLFKEIGLEVKYIGVVKK